MRLAGGFHLVPSSLVSAYFTGLLALLTIRLVPSKIVIFQKNGVRDGREMCFGQNNLCLRFMPSGVMISEKSDCESLHDGI